MDYSVSKLANEYVRFLQSHTFELKKTPLPTFNLDAYNEYKYVSVMRELNQSFDSFDDCHITEKFLKGE